MNLVKNGNYNKYTKNYKRPTNTSKQSSTPLVIKEMGSERMKNRFLYQVGNSLFNAKTGRGAWKESSYATGGNGNWYHLNRDNLAKYIRS